VKLVLALVRLLAAPLPPAAPLFGLFPFFPSIAFIPFIFIIGGGHPFQTVAARARTHAERSGDSRPHAPDGMRGLGEETSLAELLRVVRAGEEEDQRFLASLASLEADVRLLLASSRERYRVHGYFELVGPLAEPALAELHAAFLAAEARPLEVLAAGEDDPRALAYARMFVDARFRARVSLSVGWEDDARELRKGLAVLRATTDGFVQLEQREAHAIARRVDLAASLLRARRNDLQALRSPERDLEGGRVDEVAVKALFARAQAPRAEERKLAMVRAQTEAILLEQRMSRSLFTTRLASEARASIDERARVLAQAAPLRVEALRALPDSPEGRDAADPLRRLGPTERMRWAQFKAREGLALDPLDEDLAWAAAHSADFLFGPIESRPLYDRFLALRGLRAHDHRTLRGRDLDVREEEALEAVQRPLVPARKGSSF